MYPILTPLPWRGAGVRSPPSTNTFCHLLLRRFFLHHFLYRLRFLRCFLFNRHRRFFYFNRRLLHDFFSTLFFRGRLRCFFNRNPFANFIDNTFFYGAEFFSRCFQQVFRAGRYLMRKMDGPAPDFFNQRMFRHRIGLACFFSCWHSFVFVWLNIIIVECCIVNNYLRNGKELVPYLQRLEI
jgi:hypothetical protein